MTGEAFKAAVKAAGYNQGQFAAAMGVHRTLIGRLFDAQEVDRHWVYAQAGLVDTRASDESCRLVAEYDTNSK